MIKFSLFKQGQSLGCQPLQKPCSIHWLKDTCNDCYGRWEQLFFFLFAWNEWMNGWMTEWMSLLGSTELQDIGPTCCHREGTEGSVQKPSISYKIQKHIHTPTQTVTKLIFNFFICQNMTKLLTGRLRKVLKKSTNTSSFKSSDKDLSSSTPGRKLFILD